MQARFVTADVFTDRRFGGNPLAVFPDGRGIDDALMQTIAREFNLSETVFVLPPENPAHTRKLRIFTPAAELPFAGHPTVGTAHVLAAIGDIALKGTETDIVFEEGVGPVPVTIGAATGAPIWSRLTVAQLPEFRNELPDAATLAALLSLAPEDVIETEADAPVAISCGVPFTFVPLASREAVGRAVTNLQVWQQHLADHWAPAVFLFAHDAETEGVDVHARMYSPSFGIPEDPATGAANAAFGGYLARRAGMTDGTHRWRVEQGVEMGRPSFLDIEADVADGSLTAVRVGGRTVIVSHGEMEVS